MSTTKNLGLFKHDEPLETSESQFDIKTALNDNWDLVDEAIGTDRERMTKTEENIKNIETKNEEQDGSIRILEQDNQANIRSIETLQAEKTELQEEVERLRADNEANAIVGQAEGESITINDASDARFKKFEINGNNKQDVTEQGINIIDLSKIENKTLNGITVTNNNDGSLLLNGTATALVQIAIRTGTLETDGTTAYTYICYGLPEDCYTNLYFVGDLAGELLKVFTATEDKAYNAVIVIPFGVTIDATVKPFLVQGTYNTSTIPEFGEFVPNSPTIDYPSEVKTVKNANIKITNGNLYNVNDKYKFHNDAKIEEDNYISISSNNSDGTTTSYKNAITNKCNLVQTNTNYYIVVEIKSVSGEGDLIAVSKEADSQMNQDCTYSFSDLKNGDIKVGSILTKKNFDNSTNFLKTYVRFRAGQTGSIKFRISVFEDEQTVDTFRYKAYEEQSFTVPVQQEMLEGDKFEKIDEKWFEVHRWGKEIIDGTKEIALISANSGGFSRWQFNYLSAKVKAGGQKFYSNKLKLIQQVSGTLTEEGIIQRTISKDDVINIVLKNTRLTEVSISGINAFLAENPMTIYFPYKEQYYEYLECTQEQSEILNEIEKTMHSYKEKTHIYSTDEVSPIFEVEYNKDLSTIINNMQAQILAE